MKKVIFDMETGDPDDLITLLLLLNNPSVTLKAITCYEGSPIQIGLINHVLNLAQLNIPVGGLNSLTPETLSPYYTDVVGKWQASPAILSPFEVLKATVSSDTYLLTGAPLTNIAYYLKNSDTTIEEMTVQGGYLGALVHNPLSKFKGKSECRTYNLGSDVEAFDSVNNSDKIKSLTYVTKDICHGFIYTPEIHKTINFSASPISQLLKKALGRYANNGKTKAMHDPLAMLMMLNKNLGETQDIFMSYRIDEKHNPVFSSTQGYGHIKGVVNYDNQKAWSYFKELCEY